MTGYLYTGGTFGSRARREHARQGRPDAGPRPDAVPEHRARSGASQAYVAWRRYIGATDARLPHHTGTLVTLESIEIPVDGQLVGMTLGPRPPGVSALNVLVEDRVATLTWTSGQPVDRDRSRSSKPDSRPVQRRCGCRSASAPPASPSPVCRRGATRSASGPRTARASARLRTRWWWTSLRRQRPA